jgi:hypothetical protein
MVEAHCSSLQTRSFRNIGGTLQLLKLVPSPSFATRLARAMWRCVLMGTHSHLLVPAKYGDEVKACVAAAGQVFRPVCGCSAYGMLQNVARGPARSSPAHHVQCVVVRGIRWGLRNLLAPCVLIVCTPCAPRVSVVCSSRVHGVLFACSWCALRVPCAGRKRARGRRWCAVHWSGTDCRPQASAVQTASRCCNQA